MEATLLLRLAAPMQAWGAEVRSTARQHTQSYPTKSGIIGLLANALGRGLDEDISDLVALHVGVRLDHRGTILPDYVAMRNVATSDGKRKNSHVYTRTYIHDGAFLAGLSGDRGLLEQIASALNTPARVLFLGRRSCLPTAPLCLEIVDGDLEHALTTYPWLAKRNRRHPATLLALIEDTNGPTTLYDVPLGTFGERRFGERRARWLSIKLLEPEEAQDD